MKKQLLALLMLAVLSAVAFAGPSINPWFEVNVPEIIGGSVLPPTLDAGVSVEGMLSPSWFIDLGFTYSDPNLLAEDDDLSLGFESNIGFDELVTVNTTGSLLYGCLLSLTCDMDYNVNYPSNFDIVALTPGLMAEGYVGPLTVWAGVGFPLSGSVFGFEPFFGMRVDFDIEL